MHLTLSLDELDVLSKGDFYISIIHLGLQRQGGGLLGALLTVILLFLFKDIGSYIVISAFGVLALLLITNSSLIEIITGIFRCSKIILSFVPVQVKVLSVLFSEEKSSNLSEEKYPVKKYEDYEMIPSIEEKEEK